MDTRPGKKWQNLVHRKCPCDGGTLQPLRDNPALYRCITFQCDFLIKRQSLITILTDETHILRGYLSPADWDELDKVVEELRAMPEIN